MATKKSAKARYEQLSNRRQPFLDRAYFFAEATIPALLPRPGTVNYLAEPYTSLTAYGVKYLSSRMTTALLPPGMSPFVLDIPAEVKVRADKMEVPKDVTLGLAKSEKLVTSEIERQGWRQPTGLALQLLLVTGNVLEYLTPQNKLRVFRLDQYVVVRDPTGNVMEIVIEEKLAPVNLPKDIQGLVKKELFEDATASVCLYTWVRAQRNGTWKVHQELEDAIIESSRGTFKVSPYNALRWEIVPGEDYGRSHVEDHWGDVKSLEGLEKSALEGAALAARNITLVRPNATGLNLKQRMAKARNGDVLVANPDDIHMLQYDNVQGMQVASALLQEKRKAVGMAFLLNSATTRNAERVTAEEIRQNVDELDGVLGGAYSMLAQEMMRPRIERLIFQMQDQGKLPDWPTGSVSPVLTTGLEALRRERDIQRVLSAGQFLQGLGPEAQEYAKMPVLLTKAFTALQIEDAVRTDDEVAQRRQQMAATQAIAGGAETAIGAAGQAAVAKP